MLTYVTNEPLYKKIVDSRPRNLKRVLDDENPGLVRRYAIPGSDRCVECHMGSPSADFVLGFIPLQLRRRASHEGGSYEATGTDELTQLERLIDYGVITGMKSPSEVLLLEDSQGTRKARNEYELKAQAYLLGNCAHCHNPRGFASIKQPLLVEALDLLPSEKGGVFQFPLDRMSPLRRRGPEQNVPMPYITPSLHDFEAIDGHNYTNKWVVCEPDSPFCDPAKQVSRRNANPFGPGYIPGVTANPPPDPSPLKVQYIEAPWRSLIYRNVDTPFIYAEDFVLFPHMPRNTAGHDCRAPRIVGDWMVSIPARRKNAKDPEFDTEPQPFEELVPGDPYYGFAQDWAQERLREYRANGRYGFCPDVRDIVDHDVLRGATKQCEAPPLAPTDNNIYDPQKPEKVVMFQEGVPDKGHWIVADYTDPPGSWYPRRLDWSDFLGKPESIPPDACSNADFKAVPELLQNVRIDEDFRRFATEEFPLGLVEGKAGVRFQPGQEGGGFRARSATELELSQDGQSAGAGLQHHPRRRGLFHDLHQLPRRTWRRQGRAGRRHLGDDRWRGPGGELQGWLSRAKRRSGGGAALDLRRGVGCDRLGCGNGRGLGWPLHGVDGAWRYQTKAAQSDPGHGRHDCGCRQPSLWLGGGGQREHAADSAGALPWRSSLERKLRSGPLRATRELRLDRRHGEDRSHRNQR